MAERQHEADRNRLAATAASGDHARGDRSWRASADVAEAFRRLSAQLAERLRDRTSTT
jgi:hypothetical protein